MRTARLLNGFRHSDPSIQEMLESVAEHAYAQGQRDQSAEMTRIAIETDRRVSDLLTPRQPFGVTIFSDDNIH